MNLLELMLKEEIEWPVRAEYAAQDQDRLIAFYDKRSRPFIDKTNSAWCSKVCPLLDKMIKAEDLALDWSSRVITSEEYQAAGGKMLINGGE